MKNEVYASIMGLVVGDALGVPVEFHARDSYQLTDMVGMGTHNQPLGTWSDDSSMTLATLESLCRCAGIQPQDIMQNFVAWLYEANFTAHGEVFDVGITTQTAIQAYQQGKPWQDCGEKDRFSNGNGSLMRILPLLFFPHSEQDIDAVSSLTHAHPISKEACRLYLQVANALRKQQALPDILSKLQIDNPVFARLPQLAQLSRADIHSTGYVVHTLEAALWCLLHSESYRDCVLLAVNLGDDTDTVAAVAGGLAGLCYGTESPRGIPATWVKHLPKQAEIARLCAQVQALQA